MTPCWHKVMEHKCVWTTVVDKELTCIAFSQHAQESFTTSTRTILLHRWSARVVLFMAFSTTWCNYLNGRVRVLIEGRYYFIQHRQPRGYYSRANTIWRAGTIRGNTVTPIRRVIILRLELCGALTLSLLLHCYNRVFGIHPAQELAWTDSTVVLSWLSSTPRHFKTYVGNCVTNHQAHSSWSLATCRRYW